MKNVTCITAFVTAMAATSVFAHHPAVDIVDEETYDMITENLEAADSPHLTMDLDTMGSAAGIDAGGSAMDQSLREQAGPAMSQAGVEPAMDPVMVIDTIGLLEEVDNALAE